MSDGGAQGAAATTTADGQPAVPATLDERSQGRRVIVILKRVRESTVHISSKVHMVLDEKNENSMGRYIFTVLFWLLSLLLSLTCCLYRHSRTTAVFLHECSSIPTRAVLPFVMLWYTGITAVCTGFCLLPCTQYVRCISCHGGGAREDCCSNSVCEGFCLLLCARTQYDAGGVLLSPSCKHQVDHVTAVQYSLAKGRSRQNFSHRHEYTAVVPESSEE